MPVRFPRCRNLSRAAAVTALLALAAGVSGCAQVGDSLSPIFVDPAKYELYDCSQLETERKGLIARAKDQEALMTKAQTGVGGTVVSEMVYRNELISIRAQQKLLEDNWRRSRCHEAASETAAAAPPSAPPPGAKPSRSGIR